jgi:hypothetical protein
LAGELSYVPFNDGRALKIDVSYDDSEDDPFD